MHCRTIAIPLSAALAAVLAPDAAAQTFIVDAANGPGTHFTDLATAVNQVPGGATLLVRPGSYGAFATGSKSLTIVGQRSAAGEYPTIRTNALFTGITVSSLAADRSFTLSGFRIANSAPAELAVRNCAGAVVLEDLTWSADTEIRVSITDSANVHANGLLVSAFLVTATTPSLPPVVVRSSSVEFRRLRVQGYRSTDGNTAPTPAMSAAGSRLLLVDPSLSGGAAISGSVAGGSGLLLSACTLHAWGNVAAATPIAIEGGFSSSGTGGTGVVLQQGSTARFRGFAPTGGFGLSPGQPFTRDAGSSIEQDAADVPPSAALAGEVRPGNTVRYTLHARPGAAAGLLLGLDARLVPSPALTLGALGLAPLVVLPAGSVPAAGVLQVASTVPAGWPTATVILAQFLVFAPGRNELAASNLFTATSRF